MKRWYLLVLWDGLTIGIFGPRAHFESIRKRAIKVRREEGDKHGVHWLSINERLRVDVGDFSNRELEDPPAEEGKVQP